MTGNSFGAGPNPHNPAQATASLAKSANAASDRLDQMVKSIDRLITATGSAQARELAGLKKEVAGLAKQTAAGGGRLAALGNAGRLAGGVGMSIGGMALAGARSGLQGTVEEARLNHQIGLLNKQLAGALVPAVTALTSAVKYLREKVERISPLQQRMLGWGMAGVGAAGTLATGATMLKAAHNIWRGPAMEAGASAAGTAVGQQVGQQTLKKGGESALKSGATQAGAGAAGGAGAGLLGRLGGMVPGAGVALGAVNAFMGPETRRDMTDSMFGKSVGGMAEFALSKAGPAPMLADALHGRMPWQDSSGRNIWSAESGAIKGKEDQGTLKKDDGGMKKTNTMLLGGGFEQAGSAWYRMADAYQKTGGEEMEKKQTTTQERNDEFKELEKQNGILERIQEIITGMARPENFLR